MDSYLRAIKEDPNNREPYIAIAEMYYMDQKFEKALTWVEMGMQRPEKESMTVQNPLAVTYRPLLIYAECQFNLGKIDEALNAAKKAQKYRNDDLVKQMIETFNKIKGHQLAARAIADVAKFLELEGEKNKARLIFDQIIPESLKDNPYLLNMRKKYFKPKKWPKKSVVIFTGNCVIGNWGPWSLKEGIGGSEEAVIRLSRRLTEQGYSVTVYSMPGDRAGVYDKVTWKNYWEFDSRDTFDVLIGWRNPWFFDTPLKARKKYLWLHDVMPEGEFTENRLNNLDKVIVLSQYHRGLFPNIPDNKIWLSANGIDSEEFEGSETHERNPHKILFASSHVRGLAHILEIWPDVKKAVPDAEFHFFYGRDSFVAVHKDNPERLAWLEGIEKRMKELPDVYDHGKVSQDVIAEETMSSGIWAYPCPFPEISCITAMKSQAGGAIPVASNFAALNETIQFGVKMPMLDNNGVGVWNKKIAKEYKAALIDMLKDTAKQERIRKEMIPWAKQNFSWTKVAQDWIKEFEK
jgi:glycosyltransferase involved in cell wall biosynthesis